MNKNLTDITILLDRSGSMESIADDVVGGIDSFIKDQQKVTGECLISLVQFDSQNPHDIIYEARDISEITGFSREQFKPRAMTPLLEAVGTAIKKTGQRLAAMAASERPGNVMFVIFTDGYENDSAPEFKNGLVKEMIKEQEEKYNWHFLFLGAGIDAFAEGDQTGFSHASTATVGKGRIGDVMTNYSAKLATYRGMSAGGQAVCSTMLDFTTEEQADFQQNQ